MLRPEGLALQQADQNTIYLHPANGANNNPGTKDRPLKTLAAAARRVNKSSGEGAMTVVLSEGIYAVGETTLSETGTPFLLPDCPGESSKETKTHRSQTGSQQ